MEQGLKRRFLFSAILFAAIGQASAQVSGPSGTYSLQLASAGSLPAFGSPLTGPAGTYTTVTTAATTIKTTTDSAGNTVVTITWGGTGPVPPTPPAPSPAPAPVPSSTNLWVISFFDQSAATKPPDALLGLLGADSVDRISAAVAKASSTATTTYKSADVSSPTFAAWAPDKAKCPCIVAISTTTDSTGKLVGTLVPGYPVPIPSGATVAEVESKLVTAILAMRAPAAPVPAGVK